jgi:hypothetical protein
VAQLGTRHDESAAYRAGHDFHAGEYRGGSAGNDCQSRPALRKRDPGTHAGCDIRDACLQVMSREVAVRSGDACVARVTVPRRYDLQNPAPTALVVIL